MGKIDTNSGNTHLVNGRISTLSKNKPDQLILNSEQLKGQSRNANAYNTSLPSVKSGSLQNALNNRAKQPMMVMMPFNNSHWVTANRENT